MSSSTFRWESRSTPSPESVARSAGRARSLTKPASNSGARHSRVKSGREASSRPDADPPAQGRVDLLAVERVGLGRERRGVAVDAARVVVERLVEREHRRRAQVGGELPLELDGLLVHGVQVLLGHGAPAGVEIAAAGRVGLVHEPRAHLAVGHVLAVERDGERGLGVGDVLAQVLHAVSDVGLGGEPAELDRSALVGQRLSLLERAQVGVALVHLGDLVRPLVPGAVGVVLLERLCGHLLEALAVLRDGDRHGPRL